MNAKILLVDDEVNLLQSLRRSLRNKYELTLAEGGEAALKALQADGSFAVIVSDMQMPNINGLKVLTEARKVSPNTVRVMLTGNIDQKTAVDAVNLGGVFRFVNKPCDPQALAVIIDQAIALHEQLAAEKILLSRTLTATVGLSTELLALANPQAHGRASRLRQLAKKIGPNLGFGDFWQLEIAAMLSQIGCISAAQQADKPVALNSQWDAVLKQQAEASSQMICKIPRLERPAAIILHQYCSDTSKQLCENDQTYAQVLRMLIDYDHLDQAYSTAQAIKTLQRHPERYPVRLVELLANSVMGDAVIKSLSIHELMPGMILEEHILTSNGDILISKGHELTDTLLQRLRTFKRSNVSVREPVMVRTWAKNSPLLPEPVTATAVNSSSFGTPVA